MPKNGHRLKPRPSIVRMDPYRPPSSGREGKLRLDFNENTVGCSARVSGLLKKIPAERFAVYPEYEKALPKFARHFGVNPSRLVLTNGTDEAIQLLVNTFVNAGEQVLVLRPSYAMYRFYAQVAGARIEEVDYLSDLGFPEKKLIRAVNAGTRAVFLANPNNPTGTSASPAQLKALLKAAPRAAVLIDEAYFEFFGQTVVPWISRYPNLFVSRTFSKAYGLAALRLGCLFSRAENIRAIRKGQSPYSVNSMAVALALEAIRDTAFVKRYVSGVLRARGMLCEELDALGIRYFPSDANFVLVQFGDDAQTVCRRLGEQGILVRDRGYEIPGCVRITVGTISQTRKLIGILRRYWQSRKAARASFQVPRGARASGSALRGRSALRKR